MIDVSSFTRELTKAFKERYAEHFTDNENAEFTEDLVRMMSMVAALAIEKYDRDRQS